MLRAPAADGALLHAHHQRHGELPPRHVAQLGGMVYELVHRQRQEIDEHDLDDRPPSGERRPDRHAHDAVFADRRVHNPFLAEFFDQPGGHAERSADRNIFPQHYDAGVGVHFVSQRPGQPVDEPHARHRRRLSRTRSR